MRKVLWSGLIFVVVLVLGSWPRTGIGGGKGRDSLRCPRDIHTLRKKYMEAYNKLLAVMGTGEGGKMDTLQKRKADEVYRFYKHCYTNRGVNLMDKGKAPDPLLLNGSSTFSRHVLSVDTFVAEPVPYESLKRVEISIRNAEGREFFRAMVNRSPRCAPIPPNAFGIYPVGEKEKLKLKDVKSAGMEARVPVKTKYGALVKGCTASWGDGILKIHWQIDPLGWELPDGKGYIFVKIVSAAVKNARWNPYGRVEISEKRRNDAVIRPKFFLTPSGMKVKKSVLSKVTLVGLRRVAERGAIRTSKKDPFERYRYRDVSKKILNFHGRESIHLPPGFYQFRYNDVIGNPPVGFYGKSRVFEAKPGGKMDIPIWVYPAM